MGQQFTVKSMLRGLDGNLGDDDYIEPLEILVDSINKHNKFNIFGKVAFNHQLKNRLNKDIINFIKIDLNIYFSNVIK